MLEYKEYFLHPGYIFISDEPYIISTILGSCVSIAIWDDQNKIGGMNHYIYAHSNKSHSTAKYGDVSIPHMLKLLKRSGANISNLKAYIVGGAKNVHLSSIVGDENIELAHKLLKKYNIKLISCDTGGLVGRKIKFNNYTGEISSDKIENKD